MNAQRAKYDAAIVYNVGSDYLITMTAGHGINTVSWLILSCYVSLNNFLRTDS